MWTRGILICFIGLDGSGKTTQAEILAKSLKSQGIGAKYVHNRLVPTISQPFMSLGRVLFFGSRGKFQNYGEFSVTRKKVFKNPLLSRAYLYSLLLDYLCQTLLKATVPLMRGDSVVCDRYVHDMVIDLAIDLDYSLLKAKSIIEKLYRFVPRPDLMFFLDVPVELAYQRKNDIPSMDFLKERRGAYIDLGKEYGAVVLDGSKDPAELANLVHGIVGQIIHVS